MQIRPGIRLESIGSQMGKWVRHAGNWLDLPVRVAVTPDGQRFLMPASMAMMGGDRGGEKLPYRVVETTESSIRFVWEDTVGNGFYADLYLGERDNVGYVWVINRGQEVVFEYLKPGTEYSIVFSNKATPLRFTTTPLGAEKSFSLGFTARGTETPQSPDRCKVVKVYVSTRPAELFPPKAVKVVPAYTAARVSWETDKDDAADEFTVRVFDHQSNQEGNLNTLNRGQAILFYLKLKK